jgi:hypothetical protein
VVDEAGAEIEDHPDLDAAGTNSSIPRVSIE